MSGCIAVKLRYSNFETITRQSIISYTASDHHILEAARQLFLSCWDKSRPVRLLGVRCSQLVDSSYQLSLFENQEEEKKLYSAIDDIKTLLVKRCFKEQAPCRLHKS
jgi:DNA polymerase-4